MSTQTTTDLPTADAVRAVVPEVLGRTVGGRDGFVVVLIQERHAGGGAPLAAATMSALNAVPGWRAYGGTGRDWKTGESSTRITVHGAPPVEREETRAERTMRVLRAAGFTVVDEATHPAGEDAARTPEAVLVNAYGSYRVGSPTHVYGERADEQATYVLRQAGAVVCGAARTTGVVWPDLSLPADGRSGAGRRHEPPGAWRRGRPTRTRLRRDSAPSRRPHTRLPPAQRAHVARALADPPTGGTGRPAPGAGAPPARALRRQRWQGHQRRSRRHRQQTHQERFCCRDRLCQSQRLWRQRLLQC